MRGDLPGSGAPAINSRRRLNPVQGRGAANFNRHNPDKIVQSSPEIKEQGIAGGINNKYSSANILET